MASGKTRFLLVEKVKKTNNITGKPHYSWIIAFAGLLIAGAGSGIHYSCLGVFVKPVCEDLGFLRGHFTMYSSINMFTSMILMPFFGTLFQRFGFRRVAIVGALICGMMQMGYSIALKLWHFYLLAFVAGLFFNGIGFMSIGILVNKWFYDKRGLATGIACSGSGLMAAVLIPIANRFIELNGWRWTYRFLACVSLSVLVPAILFIVKNKPEDIGLEPYQSKKGVKTDNRPGCGSNAGLTRHEAVRTVSFWLLAIAAMGISLCQTGPSVHTLPFLTDIGYPIAFASAVASTYLLLLTVAKIMMGFALDRLGSLKGSLLIGVSCVLFPIFALLAAFPVSPWFYALTLGMATSGITILGPVLTENYFGRKDFSKVYSIISMFSFIGGTISSPLLGIIYDKTGSYSPAWFLIIGIGIVVCSCLIGAFRMSKKNALSF